MSPTAQVRVADRRVDHGTGGVFVRCRRRARRPVRPRRRSPTGSPASRPGPARSGPTPPRNVVSLPARLRCCETGRRIGERRAVGRQLDLVRRRIRRLPVQRDGVHLPHRTEIDLPPLAVREPRRPARRRAPVVRELRPAPTNCLRRRRRRRLRQRHIRPHHRRHGRLRGHRSDPHHSSPSPPPAPSAPHPPTDNTIRRTQSPRQSADSHAPASSHTAATGTHTTVGDPDQAPTEADSVCPCPTNPTRPAGQMFTGTEPPASSAGPKTWASQKEIPHCGRPGHTQRPAHSEPTPPRNVVGFQPGAPFETDRRIRERRAVRRQLDLVRRRIRRLPVQRDGVHLPHRTEIDLPPLAVREPRRPARRRTPIIRELRPAPTTPPTPTPTPAATTPYPPAPPPSPPTTQAPKHPHHSSPSPPPAPSAPHPPPTTHTTNHSHHQSPDNHPHHSHTAATGTHTTTATQTKHPPKQTTPAPAPPTQTQPATQNSPAPNHHRHRCTRFDGSAPPSRST